MSEEFVEVGSLAEPDVDSIHPFDRGRRIARHVDKLYVGWPDKISKNHASEIPGFLPTVEELYQLAKYWGIIPLRNYYQCFLLSTGDTGWRECVCAMDKVKHIAQLIGADVVKSAIDEAIVEFGQRQNSRYWTAYWYGTDEERNEIQEEIQQEMARACEDATGERLTDQPDESCELEEAGDRLQ